MKPTPNEKEPEVSSYRPQGDYTDKVFIPSASPKVKNFQSLGTRIFDWLAAGALYRGKCWEWKRLGHGHLAWKKTNPGNNALVLHWVRFLWYGQRGVLRLTNKSGLCLPKSFWPRWSPEANEKFELSLLPEELLEMDREKF